ncbi:phenolic acid decarboxylase padC [Mycobacterium sp. 1165196.3]|uniref:phenolic acid decarboxylase n=1 Tax=unclassified Mycobacterium TaxID=2642494 RepID=UPI0007FDED4E|nr:MULTISPECIES: phenolic acid decarboxylase [unclassified Mycobacterium]OBK32827.1 phenolic acid decarboxylase padC [Mycobacterium sp. 1165196.3]OBL01792.1 phenolic acid decarboxylase padC [Mycobacterium sp. 1245499.0]
MTSVDNPIPAQDLSGIVGHRFIYTYANGWQYEMYVKNATTIDYRIHSGHVGGRWVKGQHVNLVQLDDDSFKLSWSEPTGTCVAVNVLPAKRRVHGVIFFPQWIRQHGERTVCFQNEHLDEMQAYRDQGPTYPIYEVPEFAYITLFEYVGADDESVIDTGPEHLPAGWADRTN